VITLRRSHERGHADHGWLKSAHTFSFANYYDPEYMGFRVLRVINDDYVAPSAGFPTHGHKDMEIVTYVLSGALEHKDSMGNGSVIRPGDVQRMSAGTGVQHSEYNASSAEQVHLLQIWILPSRNGIRPGYEQKTFPESEKLGKLRLVASPDGADGSVTIHQDARIYASILDPGNSATHALAPGRHAWVHVASGELELNGKTLGSGDAAAVSAEDSIRFTGKEKTELLLFDLP